MTDRQSFLDGIFALQDMHVRAADRGRRYPKQRIERADIRYWLLIQDDPPWLDENCGLHSTY